MLTNYALARTVASEYSWCKPPKIDLIRTSVSAANRVVSIYSVDTRHAASR
jgi:hypothetical protein